MTLYGLRRGRMWLCLPSPEKRVAILRKTPLINRACPPWADPAAAWVPGLKLAAASGADAHEPWDAWLTPSLDLARRRQQILAALPPSELCMGGSYSIASIPVDL